MNLKELNAYIEKLSRHDWYHAYSDDHRVWSSGNASIKELQSIAKDDKLAKQALDAFYEFHFSGDSFGKPKFTQEMLDAKLAELRNQVSGTYAT